MSVKTNTIIGTGTSTGTGTGTGTGTFTGATQYCRIGSIIQVFFLTLLIVVAFQLFSVRETDVVISTSKSSVGAVVNKSDAIIINSITSTSGNSNINGTNPGGVPPLEYFGNDDKNKNVFDDGTNTSEELSVSNSAGILNASTMQLNGIGDSKNNANNENEEGLASKLAPSIVETTPPTTPATNKATATPTNTPINTPATLKDNDNTRFSQHLPSVTPATSRIDYLKELMNSISVDDKNDSYDNSTREKTAIDHFGLQQRKQAIDFVYQRMEEYDRNGLLKRWRMRGVGYLFWYWNLILIAEWKEQHQPIHTSSKETDSETEETQPLESSIRAVGPNVITIHNVLSLNKPHVLDFEDTMHRRFLNSRTNCNLWTLYVRVNGPEIFAGSAKAVVMNREDDDNDKEVVNNSYCYWEFHFNVQIPGPYQVDTRVLYYNGTSLMESECIVSNQKDTVDFESIVSSLSKTNTNHKGWWKTTSQQDQQLEPIPTETGNQEETIAIVRAGFKGFKMYSPNEMCCEICSRLSPDCIYWSTPPEGLLDPSFTNMGCDLYFANNESEWIPESMFVNNTEVLIVDKTVPRLPTQRRGRFQLLRNRRQKEDISISHGPVHEDGTREVYFAGCGWSFWMTLDFPCLNGTLDDQIPVFFVKDSINNSEYMNTVSEKFRVVITDEASADVPQQEPGGMSTIDTIVDDSSITPTVGGTNYENLPLCAIESELPENHKGRWVRGQWPTDQECPIPINSLDTNYSQLFEMTTFDPDNPKCYYRENLSRIGNECIEMNCRFIDQTRIWRSDLHNEEQFYGHWNNYHCRYADYTNEQLQQCINERKIHTFTGSGHSIWNFLRQYLMQRLDGLVLYNNSNDSNGRQQQGEGMTIHISTLSVLHHKVDELRKNLNSMPEVIPTEMEYYWINSIYASSEREHEARGPVQVLKSKVAREILEPKKYRMLNFYDLTAAFTYDSATQMDGLHVIGPPMKALIGKLFHYVCYNTSVSLQYVNSTKMRSQKVF